MLCSNLMRIVTRLSEEKPIARCTDLVGFWKLARQTRGFGSLESYTVLPLKRPTPFSFARVLASVFVLITTVTIMTKIRFVKKTTKGVAAMVMILKFNETSF